MTVGNTDNPEMSQHAGASGPDQPAPRSLDRHDLYELCAQHPSLDARLLDAVYAQYAGSPRDNDPADTTAPRNLAPRHLTEDFCGTAALSRAWLALDPDRRATAIDHDPDVIDTARQRARAASLADRLQFIQADVRGLPAPAAAPTHSDAQTPDPSPPTTSAAPAAPPADLIFAGNFSICEIHDRPALIEYLRRARARLARGGVLACDLYAGADAHARGEFELDFHTPEGARITYTWEQRAIDPTTARVVNAMHFTIHDPHNPHESTNAGAAHPDAPAGNEPAAPAIHFRDAFVYDWRLWSPAELRDAMADAGFARTDVYERFDHAEDERGRIHARPITRPDELDESHLVLVTARA